MHQTWTYCLHFVYKEKLSPWHTSIVATKSHISISLDWMNLTRLWIDYSKGSMVVSLDIVRTLWNKSKKKLALPLPRLLRIIFRRNLFYFATIHDWLRTTYISNLCIHIFQNFDPLFSWFPQVLNTLITF